MEPKYLKFIEGNHGGVISRHSMFKYSEETGKICLISNQYRGRMPKPGEVWLCQVIERPTKRSDLVMPLQGPYIGLLGKSSESGWENTWGAIHAILGNPDIQEWVGYNKAEGNTDLYLSVWKVDPRRLDVLIAQGMAKLASARQVRESESARKLQTGRAEYNDLVQEFGLKVVRALIPTTELQAKGVPIECPYAFTDLADLARVFRRNEKIWAICIQLAEEKAKAAA